MSTTEANTDHNGDDKPSVHTERVRELAYQIWETEGCPDGQAERHWELAHKLAEVEAREEPAPVKRGRTLSKPHEATVTAAEITMRPAARKSRAAKAKETTTHDT